ncbi:MAG: DUF2069 domain-containing protein [Burkholderiales bacterium]|nr:DUF2069 domain-containing protein [Burkholderiales bacterium]
MSRRLVRACALLSVLLIVLCVAWEWKLAPLRPGGSWLWLKAVPLALLLPGVARGANRALQWTVLLVWIYVAEGLVRAASDRGPAALLGAIEVGLALALFACAAAILRPQKKAARALLEEHRT